MVRHMPSSGDAKDVVQFFESSLSMMISFTFGQIWRKLSRFVRDVLCFGHNKEDNGKDQHVEAGIEPNADVKKLAQVQRWRS
jgi:hypothetical protein